MASLGGSGWREVNGRAKVLRSDYWIDSGVMFQELQREWPEEERGSRCLLRILLGWSSTLRRVVLVLVTDEVLTVSTVLLL